MEKSSFSLAREFVLESLGPMKKTILKGVKKEMEKSKWEEIGEIGVDAGIIWLGDPCYTFFGGSKDIGKNWGEFCSLLEEKEEKENNGVYNFDSTGVAVDSGYGDGIYPVFVKRKEGRIKEVKVVFF